MADPRIKTRCPSCGHDTLIVDDAGYLVCSLIGCEKPTMIGDAAAEIARLKAAHDDANELRDADLFVILDTVLAMSPGEGEGDMVKNIHAGLDRLKDDAAKDAEMIAELAGDLEVAEVASWRNETKGRASIERRGLCKVNGKWERVK